MSGEEEADAIALAGRILDCIAAGAALRPAGEHGQPLFPPVPGDLAA